MKVFVDQEKFKSSCASREVAHLTSCDGWANAGGVLAVVDRKNVREPLVLEANHSTHERVRVDVTEGGPGDLRTSYRTAIVGVGSQPCGERRGCDVRIKTTERASRTGATLFPLYRTADTTHAPIREGGGHHNRNVMEEGD